MNNEEIMNEIEALSFTDLKAIKEAVDALVKARREESKLAEKEAKLEAKEAALARKDELAVGAVVTFTYKGGVKTGTIVKLTDKSFHINRGEALLDGDAEKSAYISFDKLVDVISLPEVAEAATATESGF